MVPREPICAGCGVERGVLPHTCSASIQVKADLISNPTHYTSRAIECIEITEDMSFCLGNALKYMWRCGLKEGNDPIDDLKKSVWYLNREIRRLEKAKK